MNRTFKVVFNKARGSMIVANEATSSVQKKGTKLLVAMAVASVLSCSSAFAADYSPETGNVGYAEATANQALVFEGTEVLNISATGADTQVYGLLATGENSFYTNEGTINLNLASGENAAKFWKTKGMMADNNGTAVNEGTINVTNAYGMTVGSSGKTNTITNAKEGTINVDGQGAAMEVAPTGVSGTTGTAQGVANNNGTINVNSKDAYGIIVAGKGGVINQNGTLNAADGAAAILVQEETGKETSGNTIVFGESSKTYGLINIQSGTSETDKVPVTGTTLEFKQGSVFDGRILASGASTTIKGVLGISGQQNASNGAGAAIFIGNTSSSLTLKDGVFADNTITGTDVYGGAIYSYSKTELENITFEGNTIVSTGTNKLHNGGINEGAGGGAVMLKGNEGTVFKDVVFTNNSATATKNETTGGYAYGGALMVDYSTGAVTGDPRPSDVTFRVAKNLVYSGNTVSSDSTGDNFNTYGYHLPHAQAGGFLFLDRGSKATFEIAGSATLTIGSQVTEDDTDGIASSIPDKFIASETDPDKKPVNGGKHAEIMKSGLGELIVNGSLNKYYGTVNVSTGTMTVNSHWDIKNAVTVANGATLALNDFSLVDANDENNPNQDKDGKEIGGSLTVNGTLQTISSMAFEDSSAETLTLSSTMDQVKFAETGAAVVLADETYTLDYAQKAGTAFADKSVEVVMLGTIEGVDGPVTLDKVSEISGQTILNAVTIDAKNKNVQIGGMNPGENVAWRKDDLSVGAINLGTANQLTVAGTATLKLSGVEGNLVSSSEDGVEVNVNDTATLVLGGAAAQGGTLDATVKLADGAKLNVTGNADYVVAAVTGTGTVNVGEASSAGRLTVNSTKDFTGTFFADPAWKTEGDNTVEEASQLAITDVSEVIGYKVAAGQNSVVSLGADSSEATAAFNAIAGGNGLSLGDQDDQISAVLYIGEKINLGTNGGILVDGSKTEVPTVGTGLTVAANGMLIADQSAVSGDEALVTGTVAFDTNSYLGLSNAVEGEFKLANTVTGTAQVVTDNPFISGSLGENGTVTTKTDADSGLKSIESLGLQAMTRRADSVLAATVADRTSFGQQLKPGLNLWVDVAGENYQADDFDKGGEFEADMGYGTFGADVAVGNFTVGGALQYGTGTLRSSVSGIKNSIDNYGVSLYGTYSVTDNFKLGAELAYVWGENDITADQTALNQSVDTEMYSAGVRAMYEMKAGNFRFVPSIGLRVSQLSTDEMKVGAVKIEDQDQTLVQLPIAMRITAADYSTASGWTLSPSFKLAYVPTFGDKDIEVLNTAEDVIDTSPVQADFGLMAGKDNMLFNVNFMLGAGEYGSSAVGGKVGFKYAF